MGDRVLTAELAQALQDECTAEGELLAWIVNSAEGEFAARPVTAGRGALSYLLLAESLDRLRALLPPGLKRFPRGDSDPPGVVEVWCAP